MRRNPYQTALLAIGGFSLVLALMLYHVIAHMTDYVTYDPEPVAKVNAWMTFLIGLGTACFLGAILLGGVTWALRNAGADAGVDINA